MIERYNRNQILRAVLQVTFGLLAYACTYGFFRFVPAWVCMWNSWEISNSHAHMFAIACTGIVTISGIIQWLKIGRLKHYHESGVYFDLDLSTGGANAVDYYTSQVTAPAYALTQLFLSGPIQLLKAAQNLKLRIRTQAGLENKLIDLLERLRKADKWQSIAEYPGEEEEIRLLAQMKQIDFSTIKGPRFRANRDQAE